MRDAKTKLLPLVLTAALIPLAGYPLLNLPVHVVVLELVIHPTALLVFQEMPGNQQLLPVRRTAKRLRFLVFDLAARITSHARTLYSHVKAAAIQRLTLFETRRCRWPSHYRGIVGCRPALTLLQEQ